MEHRTQTSWLGPLVTAALVLLAAGCSTTPTQSHVAAAPDSLVSASADDARDTQALQSPIINLSQALRYTSKRFDRDIIVDPEVFNHPDIDASELATLEDVDDALETLLAPRRIAYTRNGRYIFVYPVRGDVSLTSARVTPTRIAIVPARSVDSDTAIAIVED